MYDKGDREKMLMNKDALIDMGESVEVADDPVRRYNFVIENYNAD